MSNLEEGELPTGRKTGIGRRRAHETLSWSIGWKLATVTLAAIGCVIWTIRLRSLNNERKQDLTDARKEIGAAHEAIRLEAQRRIYNPEQHPLALGSTKTRADYKHKCFVFKNFKRFSWDGKELCHFVKNHYDETLDERTCQAGFDKDATFTLTGASEYGANFTFPYTTQGKGEMRVFCIPKEEA
jgi:hypothetical protein